MSCATTSQASVDPQEDARLTAAERQPRVLVIENLVRRREQAGVIFELRVPMLHLDRGSFVAVVGESGCGKSTLLDHLALVAEPTSCERFELRIDGDGGEKRTDVRGLWARNHEPGLAALRRDRLGYVLQTGGLLPFLTVERNIMLPARIKGLADYRDRVRRLAERIGIDRVLSKKPQYLSGGQRQRAAILRALIHQPDIVLADEPTAAVDKERAQAIVEDFRELAREEGTTIVMVTHDRNLVEGLADCTYGFRVRSIDETMTRSTCEEIAL